MAEASDVFRMDDDDGPLLQVSLHTMKGFFDRVYGCFDRVYGCFDRVQGCFDGTGPHFMEYRAILTADKGQKEKEKEKEKYQWWRHLVPMLFRFHQTHLFFWYCVLFFFLGKLC